MSSLTIEAGKFYKTRGGDKVKIYSTGNVGINYQDGEPVLCQDIHGAIELHDVEDSSKTAWLIAFWDAYGCSAHASDNYDIVAPWTDPPVVDWSKLPKHIVAVVMAAHGGWYGFMEKPVSVEATSGDYGSWTVDKPYHAFDIRDDDCPVFSGDWRDSLAVRPGWEGE